jgi:hypothetical protein
MLGIFLILASRHSQKTILSLRDKTTELRHKSSVTIVEKEDIERRIREVKASETILKSQVRITI